MPSSRPRVVLLRGHNANVWDLRPLERLAGRVRALRARHGLEPAPPGRARAPDGRGPARRATSCPRGRAAGAAAYALGERYLGLEEHLRGAAIVHAAEIGTWFSAQAARLKAKLGFRLVLTVWETIPWRGAYRWPRERRYRDAVLPAADLLLADDRPRARRAPARGRARRADRGLAARRGPDALRRGVRRAAGAAAAAVGGAAGLGEGPPGRAARARGAAPRHRRPARARTSRMLVRRRRPGGGAGSGAMRPSSASTARSSSARPSRTTRCPRSTARVEPRARLAAARGWEEQFGMVLVEAMASGTPIVAADSGAIPEVLGGQGALVRPGDWMAMARALRAGPLGGAAARRRTPRVLARFSAAEAASRDAGRVPLARRLTARWRRPPPRQARRLLRPRARRRRRRAPAPDRARAGRRLRRAAASGAR